MKRGIVLWGMAFPMVVHAYVYEIKVLHVPHSMGNGYIIGCSDYHDKFHPINDGQRAELLNYISKPNKQSIKLILEDLSSPNVNGTCGCNQFLLTSTKGILASLTKDCQAAGIPVDNIEYRYCRVVAFGGLLAQLDASPYLFQPACITRMQCIYDEIMKMLRIVESYRDGAVLDKWYHECCAQVYDALLKLQINKSVHLSGAAYIDEATKGRDRLAVLKQLLTFDGALFDCALVHSIVHTHKKYVVAVAGGTHINRAFEKLVSLGYQPVYNSDTKIVRDYDMSKNIGSYQTPGGFCLKPEPVTLNILRTYLK